MKVETHEQLRADACIIAFTLGCIVVFLRPVQRLTKHKQECLIVK